MDDADAALAAEQEVKNPFPTPPTYWTQYTPENLRLLGLLKEKLSEKGVSKDVETIQEEDETIDQASLLQDEPLLPSFPLLDLEPPRIDWVLEQPEYSSFGETHSTNEIAQQFPPGLEQLYNPESGSDPRPHIRQLLISLLLAYHKLLSDILEPVPAGYHRPPSPPMGQMGEPPEDPDWPPPLNWEATVLWIRTLALNLGWAVNEFRPVQARMTLESMMQRQIEVRKEETKAIHTKCDELEKTLADLRSKTAALLPSKSGSPQAHPAEEIRMDEEDTTMKSSSQANTGSSFPELSLEDLMAWSKEVPLG